jgi:hypothetical protein
MGELNDIVIFALLILFMIALPSICHGRWCYMCIQVGYKLLDMERVLQCNDHSERTYLGEVFVGRSCLWGT